jgi:hypothetical protein
MLFDSYFHLAENAAAGSSARSALVVSGLQPARALYYDRLYHTLMLAYMALFFLLTVGLLVLVLEVFPAASPSNNTNTIWADLACALPATLTRNDTC